MTFTITVLPTAPGGGIPGGTVTIKDGTTVLATVTLNAQGKATFTTSTLSKGFHNITATYNGNSNYLSSVSAILALQIQNPNSG